MTTSIHQQQLEICEKYGSLFVASPNHLKIGIAKNVKTALQPINGLRYQPEGNTTGWFIWAGTELPLDDDFFVPLHVAHLEEWNSKIFPYLGLAPGWRFLFDDKGYEDVWEDLALLNK